MAFDRQFPSRLAFAGGAAPPSPLRRRPASRRDLAEARSAFVCQKCGRRGHLRDDHGWYRTACDEHGEGRPLPSRPARAGVEIRRDYIGDRRLMTARRYDFERDAFTPIELPSDYDVERACWRDEVDESDIRDLPHPG